VRALELTKNALGRLRNQGAFYTIGYARKRLSETYHEWRLGVRTVGKIDRADLGFDTSFNHCYHPADYQTIYTALGRLRVRGDVDVLLDYGSGMGRVVVAAATYPFRKVIGLELSDQLTEVARENLRRARKKLKCRDVELITGDAAAYQVPADVSCIFFYNSFHGPVLARALANVRESLSRAPRRLLFVCKNTAHMESVVDDHPWLVQRDEFRSWEFNYTRRFSHRVLILEAQGPGKT